MNKRALVVEDDYQIGELLKIHLTDINIDSEIYRDGLDGYQAAISKSYDIILLDIMLPSMDGVEICKKVRIKNGDIPIIMITSKSEEIDRVIGLETGADDYIIKPFSIREFQARVKAVLRRSQSSEEYSGVSDKVFSYDNLVVDTEKRICLKNGKRLELAPKEFDLLALLASNPGKSFNRASILNIVWGYEFEGFQHTVNSHINRIRAKIENDMASPQYILTTWGYGYRFNEDMKAS